MKTLALITLSIFLVSIGSIILNAGKEAVKVQNNRVNEVYTLYSEVL